MTAPPHKASLSPHSAVLLSSYCELKHELLTQQVSVTQTHTVCTLPYTLKYNKHSKPVGRRMLMYTETWHTHTQMHRFVHSWLDGERKTVELVDSINQHLLLCAPFSVCEWACVPPMEAASLVSFATSPSCSNTQSADCDLLPSMSASAPPTFPHLCSCPFSNLTLSSLHILPYLSLFTSILCSPLFDTPSVPAAHWAHTKCSGHCCPYQCHDIFLCVRLYSPWC